MIHYALRCAGGHGFDGWFQSSAGFDAQAEAGLVECPSCGSRSITRALMAPNVATRRAEAPPAEAATPAPVPAPAAPASAPVAAMQSLPDHLRAMLQRVRAEVEAHCDYVGPQFAETARAIADGSAEPRPIYGEATPEEAHELAEEGIDVARIPWIPRADS